MVALFVEATGGDEEDVVAVAVVVDVCGDLLQSPPTPPSFIKPLPALLAPLLVRYCCWCCFCEPPLLLFIALATTWLSGLAAAGPALTPSPAVASGVILALRGELLFKTLTLELVLDSLFLDDTSLFELFQLG